MYELQTIRSTHRLNYLQIYALIARSIQDYNGVTAMHPHVKETEIFRHQSAISSGRHKRINYKKYLKALKKMYEKVIQFHQYY